MEWTEFKSIFPSFSQNISYAPVICLLKWIFVGIFTPQGRFSQSSGKPPASRCWFDRPTDVSIPGKIHRKQGKRIQKVIDNKTLRWVLKILCQTRARLKLIICKCLPKRATNCYPPGNKQKNKLDYVKVAKAKQESVTILILSLQEEEFCLIIQ